MDILKTCWCGICYKVRSNTSDVKREAVIDRVSPIELVDGEKMIDMFEQLEFGLIPRKTFEIGFDFFNTFK